MNTPGTQAVRIGSRTVGGTTDTCLLIAEAGVNHNGDPDLAHALVDAAADAGADAVKFQTFVTQSLVTPLGATAPYQRNSGAERQWDVLKGLELPTEVWSELADHARSRDLLFLSTAFDFASLDLVLSLRVPALKLPSGEIDNLPFLRHCARQGLPLIISTGMATLDEVAAAIDAVNDAPAVCILHCVSAYPTPVDSANLRAISTMRSRFGVPVGWSDHTVGPISALVAVALGAAILEKHLTLDRALAGPDHAASADPHDLSRYVQSVRVAQVALGDGLKRPVPVETVNRRFSRRSLYAARDIASGHALKEGDLVALRPADGLSPAVDLRGTVARVAIAAGTLIRPGDLAGLHLPECGHVP